MFSPEASVASARSSLRNPRRRQRKDSDGLQQQPRTKRSKLSGNTFHSPTDAPANGKANGNGHVTMNGHASHGDANGALVPMEMPIHEKKAAPKRGIKGDTALYLVSASDEGLICLDADKLALVQTRSENYQVKKLPSFPTALSRGPGMSRSFKAEGKHQLTITAPFRATALTSAGLALALTVDHALLWDYTPVSGISKVLTLPLPFGLKTSDPLPLGAIVRNGPTNEFGILAVAPSNGKITFWDNVESAEARSHFPQRHHGIDGSLKLYSGETITEVVDIEHAGYILILSSGRLAQLTLRDSQGRPSISTYILSSPNDSNGSFFSFKGLLGGAIRKTIASVKAHSATKGQMEVITATKSGLFQLWDLTWSGQQQIFKKEIDVHAEVLAAVQQGTAPEARGLHEVHIVDFTIMAEQNVTGTVSLLVLVALSGRNQLDYSLLEVDLSNNVGTVSRVIPIRNFHQAQIPKEPSATLLLPQPGHTAFVQFPGAIVIASLSKPEESPESQLLSDFGRPTLPFQDTLYFKDDLHIQVSGHALEQIVKKDKYASALIFIQDHGIVHITAPPPATEADDIKRHKVTALSKLEQATFYSSIPGNILDFSIKSRYTFDQAEVENAAMSISIAIISSSVEQFEKVPSSMDDHLGQRASALRALITHLRTDYPTLSLKFTWRLLWHAEKLAAATQLWNWYQVKLHDKEANPDAYPESLLMSDIVKALGDKYKTKIAPELGETDPVRQFFMKDVNHLEVMIPWAWQYLRLFYLKDESKARPATMQRLSEGNDVVLVSLETAFKFRQDNCEYYGLDPDTIVDGILQPNCGYDLLPSFWTSTHNIVSSTRSLIDVGRIQAMESFEQFSTEDLAKKIAQDNPRLVKIGCQTHIERFQWALDQTDEQKKQTGAALKKEFDEIVRPEHIYSLVGIGMANEGMNLAEYYHDMPTLVHLIWDETTFLEESKANTQSKMEQAEAIVKLNRIKERIRRYFETYGDAWAEAFFSRYISENRTGQLLMKEDINQSALTRFLRADKSRMRLQWINEVIGEKDYSMAAYALSSAAMKQETNAWCSKVELSMAKLALLCKDQAEPDAPEQPEKARDLVREKRQEDKLTLINWRLEYAKIQDRVYERLLPIISGALDDESAVHLLVAEFGQGRLVERPAHQQLLQRGFEELVNNRVLEPAVLIDVLTLMTYDESQPPVEITQSNEFAFALKVLALSWHTVHKNSRAGLCKLIWKRLLLKDNWAEINDTKNVSDAQLQEFLAHTAAGWTWKAFMKMCGTLPPYSSHSSYYTIYQPLSMTNIRTDDNPFNKVVAPPSSVAELLGAGATHGELCLRFPNEDLRAPIIADNLADDVILQEAISKSRLEGWWPEAQKAGKWAFEEEKNGRVVGGHEDEVEHEEENLEGGAVQAVSVAGGDRDVDMVDS
jgi:nuclear pore complex protein Nup133